ncbi:MAG: cation diffusion facilitator family transporter [Bacteroidota bacterium]
MSAELQAIRSTYLSIAGNTVLAILKGLTGIFGNSYALIADAIESTGDIFSSTLVLFGIKYASRPADDNHPYGHGRAEPLVTFLVVGFLIISAVVIGYHSIINICTPHELPAPYTLIVLGAVIITKELFYRFVDKQGKETHSSALKADAWHHRSDAITSLAAFIGISIALYLGKGYESADDWAALIGSGVILYNSYLIFRPALGEIMDEHLYEDLVNDIKISSVLVPGVIDTEKCHIRKSGLRYFVDLHMVVNASITVYDGHEIAHDLKRHLLTEFPQLADVLIHVEPDEAH